MPRPNENTGNRKCWHVVDRATGEKLSGLSGPIARMTKTEAEDFARGADARACLDGHHFEPCPGNAHSPEVGGQQDHCAICLPRWGVVMAPDVA